MKCWGWEEKGGLKGKMKALLRTAGSSPSGEDGEPGLAAPFGLGVRSRPHLKDHTQCCCDAPDCFHNHHPFPLRETSAHSQTL